MNEYRASIDAQVTRVREELAMRKKERLYVPYADYILAAVKREFAAAALAAGLEIADPFSVPIETPPEHIAADLVVNVFPYIKVTGKKPKVLADDIVRVLTEVATPQTYIASAEAVPGYVNIKLNRRVFYGAALARTLTLGSRYGQSDTARSRTAFFDYSAPNIAKPFGIGHLRSTVIGEALTRLYEAVGYEVVRDNHLGDWGTQFGSLINAYKKWGDAAALENSPIEYLKELYVRYTREAETDPKLADEARYTFAALEKGDTELLALWKKFSDLSLQEFEKTYREFGIKFDLAIGEAYYADEKAAHKLVKEIEKKGLAKESEGAIVVEDLQDERGKKLPSFLLKKADGSSLYILRDMLALVHRLEVFAPNTVVYVVGNEQELNFRQLFALARAVGLVDPAKTALKHIAFGLVLIDGKKMSTRKGTLVSLEEVIGEIEEKARERSPENARALAVSAVIYNDLRQNRMTDIDFNWEKMLSLESGSVVYLQYAYARILSILAKAGKQDFRVAAWPASSALAFEDESEFALARRVSLFPEVLIRAVEHDSPHLVTEFLETLAAEVNHFYARVQVLATENSDLKESRLALLAAVSTTIENAFKVLNIPILTSL